MLMKYKCFTSKHGLFLAAKQRQLCSFDSKRMLKLRVYNPKLRLWSSEFSGLAFFLNQKNSSILVETKDVT